MGTTGRMALLVAIGAIALACRSRPLDQGAGTGTITFDGGGGAGDGAASELPRRLPLGFACAVAADCSSGFCEDGVCCNRTCAESCLSCATGAMRGLCLPRDPGAPARSGGCPVDPALVCGNDGTCDGMGGCRFRVNGTLCALGFCSVTALFNQKACDGRGVCRDLPTTSCDEGFGCDPETVTCRTSCVTDGGCPGRTDAGPQASDAALD